MSLRGRRPGLRVRFAAALVATSAATLIGAGLALLPPLDRRLELDRLHTVEQVTYATRPVLSELDGAELKPGAPALQAIAHGLARRVGGRVSVIAADGSVLADTDPDSRFAPRAAAADGSERHEVVRQGHEGAAATVSTRVDTAAGTVTIAVFKPLRDTRAALAVVRRALPIAALAGLLVALALAGLLSRTLLARLARLRDGARRLVRDGLAEPLPADDAADEVGELTRALELMRARLHEDARARHAFLTTASHELRTPLASLRGTLELLQDDLAGRPAALRRAAAAHHQAEQLTRLTADLLDLGRLDAGVPPRRELVDVGELAEIVASEFAADREQRAGDRLSVSCSPTGRWAVADPVAVVRILRILIDNALAHGPQGGAVTVAVGGLWGAAAGAAVAGMAGSAPGELMYVAVRDEGPGIASEERARVFARFERGAAVRLGHGRGGFGLGLAIGRELAARMGGGLTLDPGAPTTFRLRLPAAAAPARDRDEEPAPAALAG